jgi:hypothetical protein
MVPAVGKAGIEPGTAAWQPEPLSYHIPNIILRVINPSHEGLPASYPHLLIFLFNTSLPIASASQHVHVNKKRHPPILFGKDTHRDLIEQNFYTGFLPVLSCTTVSTIIYRIVGIKLAVLFAHLIGRWRCRSFIQEHIVCSKGGRV